MSRDPIYVARLDGQEDGWTPPAFIRRVRHAHTEDFPLDAPVVGTWHKEALCALPLYHHLDWTTSSTRGWDARIASRICMRCPVQRQCREEADRTEGDADYSRLSTIRAGETPKQRAIRRTEPFHSAAATAAASTHLHGPGTANRQELLPGDRSAAAVPVAGVHGSPSLFPE